MLMPLMDHSTVPPRVNSSAWVKTLKKEIREPDQADPAIFDDAEEKNDRQSSVDSSLSALYAAAGAAPFGRGVSSNGSFGLSSISLEAEPVFSGSFLLSSRHASLSDTRASTIEFLKKMGFLENVISISDDLVSEAFDPKPARKRPVSPPESISIDDNVLIVVQVEDKDIREFDILSGRGGKSNHHAGNKRFRQVVAEMKAEYRTTDVKTDKTALSKAIVEYVHGYGGRFLKRVPGIKTYCVMTKAEGRKKTSQALRETKKLKWTL